jgi:hypothetical protein
VSVAGGKRKVTYIALGGPARGVGDLFFWQANIDTTVSVQLYEYAKVYKDLLRPPSPGVFHNFKVGVSSGYLCRLLEIIWVVKQRS